MPGSTVNDAALTVVGGALRRYLQAKGELPEESLVAMVPISTRRADESDAGGNRITMMTASLATHEADPVKRMALVSMGMRGVKDLANAVGGRTLAELSDATPGLLLGIGSRAQSRMAARNQSRPPANTTVTNVPGPSEPLYFTGARVVGPYGAGPIQHGMGLIHLLCSYAGQFVFSFTADREMIPDPGFYAQCLRESLDELSAIAPPEPGRDARHASRRTKAEQARPRATPPTQRHHTGEAPNDRGGRMPSVGRVTEITAISETSFDDAIKVGIDRARATLRGLRSAVVKEQEVLLHGGAISGYRVNLAVTFILDEYDDSILPPVPNPATQTADFG